MHSFFLREIITFFKLIRIKRTIEYSQFDPLTRNTCVHFHFRSVSFIVDSRDVIRSTKKRRAEAYQTESSPRNLATIPRENSWCTCTLDSPSTLAYTPDLTNRRCSTLTFQIIIESWGQGRGRGGGGGESLVVDTSRETTSAFAFSSNFYLTFRVRRSSE